MRPTGPIDPAAPAVSVVVASRGRPRHLARCLIALAQQDYAPFEVIVVADAAGLDAAETSPLGGEIKTAAFDTPNLSAARNAGLALAAGEVVAFVDDDAAAEPTWLARLAAPFADPRVTAAGGFVLGRNGISLQWGGRLIGPDARHADLDLSGTAVLPVPDRGAVKTEGTNCAFRRTALEAAGGFDGAYRFYLDEADVNMRLARLGGLTALVPGAVVHHASAASDRRTAARRPRDLTEIGASLSVFLGRYLDPGKVADAITDHRRDQRARLVRHMVAGTCEPRDVPRLMRSFEEGLALGATRGPEPFRRTAPPPPFRPVPAGLRPSGHSVFGGRLHRFGYVMECCRTARLKGRVASAFFFSPTSLYHRVRLTDDGIWLQTGGIFGRSRRDEPLIRAVGFAARLREETQRIGAVRDLDGDFRAEMTQDGKRTIYGAIVTSK